MGPNRDQNGSKPSPKRAKARPKRAQTDTKTTSERLHFQNGPKTKTKPICQTKIYEILDHISSILKMVGGPIKVYNDLEKLLCQIYENKDFFAKLFILYLKRLLIQLSKIYLNKGFNGKTFKIWLVYFHSTLTLRRLRIEDG